MHPSTRVGAGPTGERVSRVDELLRDRRRSARPERGSRRTKEKGRQAGRGRHRLRRRDRHGRTWTRVLVVMMVGGTAFAVAGGVRPDPGRESRAPTQAPSTGLRAQASWAEVVAGLDARRNAALASTDEESLRLVDVPGSPADRSDRAAVRALRDSGVRPRGLAVVTTTVGVAWSAQDRVRLRVVDERSAYALVDRTGRAVETVPVRGAAAWTVELRRVNDAWRTFSVRPLR